MNFDILKVILNINDLWLFLILKLIIFKNFELWQIWKCAQTLVLYSQNIDLKMKNKKIWKIKKK